MGWSDWQRHAVHDRQSAAARHLPRAEGPAGSSTGPYRVRDSRTTSWPTAVHIRRTSRLRPSRRIDLERGVRAGPRLTGSTLSNRAGPSSSIDTRAQPLEHLRRRAAPHGDQVFPLDFARGVHQAVGQLAVRGEEQQPGRVHVQPADGDPAPAVGRRQALEHRAAALRVAARGHLIQRLVVDEQLPGRGRREAERHGLAVQPHVVARLGPVAELRRAAVDA